MKDAYSFLRIEADLANGRVSTIGYCPKCGECTGGSELAKYGVKKRGTIIYRL